MGRRGCTAWAAGLSLALWAAPWALIADPALAKSEKDATDIAPACDINPDGARSGKKKQDDVEGYLVPVGGICFNLSGDIQATGQAATVAEPRLGQAPPSQRSLTVKPDLRLETALPTNHGALKTAFEVDWAYNTASGPEDMPTLKEASLSYVGITAGYAESLMNF